MRLLASFVLVSVVCGVPACSAQTSAPPAEAALPSGRLMAPERVADGVWVMRQPDRLWSAVIGNVVIVEQSDGVVLFDSGGSIADGRDIVAAVSRLTPKPIKAVVLSHWHNDHPLGVPGILERYPQARVIATATTARLMAKPEILGVGVGKPDAERYAARVDGAKARAGDYRTSAADTALAEADRREYAIEAAWVLERVARQQGNFVALPTETFTDRLLIPDPSRPIEFHYLGPANTMGDAFLWLPRQRIMATGDAVVLPTPYGFTLDVTPWLATLDRLESFDFETLIPGHGAVQKGRSYLATLRWSMTDIQRQALALAADKTVADVDQASARFDRAEHRRRFGADSAWEQRWLDEYWLNGMLAAAFNRARGNPVESIDGG